MGNRGRSSTWAGLPQWGWLGTGSSWRGAGAGAGERGIQHSGCILHTLVSTTGTCRVEWVDGGGDRARERVLERRGRNRWVSEKGLGGRFWPAVNSSGYKGTNSLQTVGEGGGGLSRSL